MMQSRPLPALTAVRKEILALKDQLGAAYPATVTLPVAQVNGDSVSNFMRNGPHRKVFALYTGDGDHECDPDMSQEVECAMESACDRIYKEALVMAEALLGKSRGGFHPWDVYSPDADDFIEKHDQAYDGIAWSVEYEGGAVYCDSHAVRYWDVGGEYVFLQRGKWHGDGNFALFTVMTVTPKTGEAPPGEALARPSAPARTVGKPRDILELQDALGDTLERVPARGRTSAFFIRTDVMNCRNTYVLDKESRVIGLNLSRNDLTDLQVLKGFPHLEKLHLGDNALTSLQGLAHLDQLRELHIDQNLVEDLDGIEGLTSLTRLNINGNKVNALDRLVALTRLQALHAHDNAIHDLEPLRPLSALGELGLTRNQVRSISPLQALKNLRHLHIEQNQVDDLGVLVHLKKLTELHIRHNPVVVRMKLKLKDDGQLAAVRAALVRQGG